MLRVSGLHHIRVGVADLAANERFVRAFGLIEMQRSNDRVYFRTSGEDAFSYLVEPSQRTELKSLAFRADSRDVLLQAVKEYGATPLRTLDGPGGGEAVSLTDPDENTIDIVHGVAVRTPDPLRAEPRINYPGKKLRLNDTHPYPVRGPAQLLRLGHVGLFVGDFKRSALWYESTLGLTASDRLFAGPPGNYVGGFYRLARGPEWVDHHTVGFFAMGKPGLHHISFEVQDIEQQMFAHRHLQKEGFLPVWGVGRHPLGSHVFDLWKDPNGLRFETFTDTDWCNDQRATKDYPVQESEMDLWSNDTFERYFA
jgi:catechol 2,3-dioxygenase-like lactoylglutathione lyase family enzyme